MEDHNEPTKAHFLHAFWVADKDILDLLMTLLGSNVCVEQQSSFTPAS